MPSIAPLESSSMVLLHWIAFLSLPIALIVRLIPLPPLLKRQSSINPLNVFDGNPQSPKCVTQLSVYKALRGRLGRPIEPTE